MPLEQRDANKDNPHNGVADRADDAPKPTERVEALLNKERAADTGRGRPLKANEEAELRAWRVESYRWLASGEATPADTLGHLARDPEPDIRMLTAMNKSTSSSDLLHLLSDKVPQVAEAAAKRLPEILAGQGIAKIEAALTDKSPLLMRQYLARNESTSPSTLRSLSNDPDSGVREQVARNQNTAPEDRSRLFEERLQAIRAEKADATRAARELGVRPSEPAPPIRYRSFGEITGFGLDSGVARNHDKGAPSFDYQWYAHTKFASRPIFPGDVPLHVELGHAPPGTGSGMHPLWIVPERPVPIMTPKLAVNFAEGANAMQPLLVANNVPKAEAHRISTGYENLGQSGREIFWKQIARIASESNVDLGNALSSALAEASSANMPTETGFVKGATETGLNNVPTETGERVPYAEQIRELAPQAGRIVRENQGRYGDIQVTSDGNTFQAKFSDGTVAVFDDKTILFQRGNNTVEVPIQQTRISRETYEGAYKAAGMDGPASGSDRTAGPSTIAESTKIAQKAESSFEMVKRVGKGGAKSIGVVLAPIVVGSVALYYGARPAEAATAAADTIVPASEVINGRHAEAAMQIPERVFGFLVPILGEALGKALTDGPRETMRASGYDVDPGATEIYRKGLVNEYSFSEIAHGLAEPGSPVDQQVRAYFSLKYDEREQTAGAYVPRDRFIQKQIDKIAREAYSLAGVMDRIPSGIPRRKAA